MSGTINQTDLQSKLVLLILSFPRLKIIWSLSPYFTAEVLEELKKNHKEPDPFTAVTVGLDPSETPGARMYNQGVSGVFEECSWGYGEEYWEFNCGVGEYSGD
jgi:DNA excision repair protein ERCC-4